MRSGKALPKRQVQARFAGLSNCVSLAPATAAHCAPSNAPLPVSKQSGAYTADFVALRDSTPAGSCPVDALQRKMEELKKQAEDKTAKKRAKRQKKKQKKKQKGAGGEGAGGADGQGEEGSGSDSDDDGTVQPALD